MQQSPGPEILDMVLGIFRDILTESTKCMKSLSDNSVYVLEVVGSIMKCPGMILTLANASRPQKQ